YQHMAKTSSEILPNMPEQDNPFIKKIALHNDTEKSNDDILEQPPKDYANGATGLFNTPKKEIIHSADVVKVKAV
ncbi:ZapG family protein, partial [Vibrio sp. V20_P4S3T152]